MKKIKALGMILNLVFSILVVLQFSSYVTPVYAADANPVCCEQVGESYCVFTDESKCTGENNWPYACQNVAKCELGVCIDKGTGVCSDRIPRAKCDTGGGVFIAA